MEWVPAGVPAFVAVYMVLGLYAVVGAFLGLASTLPRASIDRAKTSGLIGLGAGAALVLLEWLGMARMPWGPAALWIPLGAGLLTASGMVGRAVADGSRIGFWLGALLGPVGWLAARWLPRPRG